MAIVFLGSVASAGLINKMIITDSDIEANCMPIEEMDRYIDAKVFVPLFKGKDVGGNTIEAWVTPVNVDDRSVVIVEYMSYRNKNYACTKTITEHLTYDFNTLGKYCDKLQSMVPKANFKN